MPCGLPAPVTTATRPLRSNGEAVMARTMSRPVAAVGPQVMVIAAPAQATAHSTLVKVPMMNRSAAPGVSVRSSG